MVNPRRNVERFAPIKARMIRLTILATTDQTEPCIDELEVFTAAETPRNVALGSSGGKAWASSEYPGSSIHKIAHLNDGQVGNSRSWISRTPGKGTITIEWPRVETIDRVVWGRDREEKYRDRLATHYYLEAAAEPGEWRVVASSLDRVPFQTDAKPADDEHVVLTSELAAQRAELRARQTALRARLGQLGTTMPIYAGTFSQPGSTHVLRRGDAMQPGDQVCPSAVAAVGTPLLLPADSPERDRRLALARWIGGDTNPLPARVMVNRVWHYHFGQGIVATPSDFGFNGGPPSHPELLDWLASRYMAGGWQLKPLHRLILLSAAYRQSSRLDRAALAIDKQNRLLWRMTPRRLETESIRDAILACSGQLDPTMGGPGYNIWEKNTNYVAVYSPRVEPGADVFRRMVYQFKPRSQQDPTFGAFDCPDAALVAPRRNVSTTALQALNLLNSPFIIRQAAFFAQRLSADAGPDPCRQADRAFELALGRMPTPPNARPPPISSDPMARQPSAGHCIMPMSSCLRREMSKDERRHDVETVTVGTVVVPARIENLFDQRAAEDGRISVDEVRHIEVPNARIDTGATFISHAQGLLIDQLGLKQVEVKAARTVTGFVNFGVYEPVKLRVQGRDCEVRVTEVAESCPVLIGFIPLEMMDFVVDSTNQRLVGNPDHGGEWMIDMF